MTASQEFVAAVRVAAQLLPITSALAQWLNEIETSRILERLEKLEDPLTRYGPKARELSKKLCALVESQPQDVPTTHVEYTADLAQFIKELRRFEADALVTGSHAMTEEFAAGLRLTPGLVVYLALLYGNRESIEKLIDLLDHAKEPLDGIQVRKSINLPLTVINSFFQEYENRGQGFTSKTIGSSMYLPKPNPPV